MYFHGIALITILTVLLLFATAIYVGRARGKYKIDAPATTGHPDFERAYRVQMNTLENAVAFLPALWLFAHYISPTVAVILGAIWLIGRSWYALAYARAAEKRGPGFGLAFFAFAILAFGALGGVVYALIR